MKKLIEIIKNNREILLPLLIIIVVFCFLFNDVLFFGKTLRGEPYTPGVLPSGSVYYTRDPGTFRGHTNDPMASASYGNPNFKIAVDQIKQGYLPWWNSFNGTGTTLLASLQSGIMFPPKLLFLFISQSPFMFDIYTIFRLFIAFSFTYFFLRLHKISIPIAFVAGFAFSFSGSLLRYVNVEHLNIDAFIPLYLFAEEYFLQKQIFKRWLVMTGALALLILGGFPEASLFAIILVSAYFIFRWFEIKGGFPLLKDWILANVTALFICLPIIIPFVINMSETWNIHNAIPHVGALALPFSVFFSLVTPYLFGSSALPRLGIASHILIPGWIGGAVILTAAMAIFLKGKDWRLGVFFAVFGFVSVLKDFGFVLINWIGYLPIISQAIVFKYLNPALTFSLVVASAFLLQYLLSRKVRYLQLIGGSVAFIAFYGFFYYRYLSAFVDVEISRSIFIFKTDAPKHFFFLIAITVIGISVLILAYLTRRVEAKKFKYAIVFALLAIISFETYISAPKYHPKRDLGYPEVPFLTTLKNKLGDEYRLSGRDYVLFPDFSGVYKIKDPRILDAMYFKGFYQFVKVVDPTFYDRFINLGNGWIQNPATLRTLGVKYVLTTSPIEEAAAITDLNATYSLPRDLFSVTSEPRPVVIINPPFDKTFKITVPEDTRPLFFYIAMSPAVWDRSKGDGVCLKIYTNSNLQNFCIDPKNNPADRIWKKVPLEIPSGTTEFDLRVVVDGMSSTSLDWVGMTDILSNEKIQEIRRSFQLTEGFPVKVDNTSIFSYTLTSPKKIAYFPDRVSFVEKNKIVDTVRKNLNKIDEEVFLGGKGEDVKQTSTPDVKIETKINGDMLIKLPKNHPKFLYVSQPPHKNLHINSESGKELKWFNANIGFIAVDTEGVQEVRISNSPSNQLKFVLIGIFALGIGLIIWRSKTFFGKLK